MSMQYRDSNQYEVQSDRPDSDEQFPQAPPDDRDSHDPEFEVREELAYNLDVE